MTADVVKNVGVIVAIITAFTSAAYNYGQLAAEHNMNLEARATQKIISAQVIELRVEVRYMKRLLERLNSK